MTTTNTVDSSDAAISLINKAIYYWDWFLLSGEVQNLIAANAFMISYRKAGGTLYQETEKHINIHIQRAIAKD